MDMERNAKSPRTEGESTPSTGEELHACKVAIERNDVLAPRGIPTATPMFGKSSAELVDASNFTIATYEHGRGGQHPNSPLVTNADTLGSASNSPFQSSTVCPPAAPVAAADIN